MQPIFEKNANRTPQRNQKKRLPPHISKKNTSPPKVAERRRTLSRGEVRKDDNPCAPAPLTPKMRLPRCDSPTAPPRLKDATSRNRRTATYGSSPAGSTPVGIAGLDTLTLPPSILPQ